MPMSQSPMKMACAGLRRESRKTPRHIHKRMRHFEILRDDSYLVQVYYCRSAAAVIVNYFSYPPDTRSVSFGGCCIQLSTQVTTPTQHRSNRTYLAALSVGYILGCILVHYTQDTVPARPWEDEDTNPKHQ